MAYVSRDKSRSLMETILVDQTDNVSTSQVSVVGF